MQLSRNNDGPEGYVVDWLDNGNKGNIYYCHDRDRKYVIKEYLNYRFIQPEPGEELGVFERENNQAASLWLEKMQKIVRCFKRYVRVDGLMNIPLRVYRQDEFIYKVTYFVEKDDLDGKEPWELPASEVDQLIKTALLQLACLARHGFVHGDIKPDNLLICRMGDRLAVSLIDYDGGFFTVDADDVTDIDFTPEYAAPELKRFENLCGGADDDKMHAAARLLTPAVDIYGIGCVYAHWLTGWIPTVENGIVRVPLLDPFRYYLIRRMLSFQPIERPDAEQIVHLLNSVKDILAAHAGSEDSLPHGYHLSSDSFSLGGDAGCTVQSDDAQEYTYWRVQGLWTSAGAGILPAGWEKFGLASEARVQRIKKVRSCLDALNCDRFLTYEVVGNGSSCGILENSPEGEHVDYLDLLQKRIARTATADRIMILILQAVELLHSKGMIAGPLSPEALIFRRVLVKTRHYLRVYVGHLWQCYSRDEVPDPGEIDLSPSRMPPEMIRYITDGEALRQENVVAVSDPRMDMWQLGRIYHYLLTGNVPSDSRDIDESIGIPRAMVIKLAMCKNWYQRTPSCLEMLEQIDAVKALPAKCESIVHVYRGEKPAADEDFRIVLVREVWKSPEQREKGKIGEIVCSSKTDSAGTIHIKSAVPFLQTEGASYLLTQGKRQVPIHWENQEKQFYARVDLALVKP